jgi:hypothetical protein
LLSYLVFIIIYYKNYCPNFINKKTKIFVKIKWHIQIIQGYWVSSCQSTLYYYIIFDVSLTYNILTIYFNITWIKRVPDVLDFIKSIVFLWKEVDSVYYGDKKTHHDTHQSTSNAKGNITYKTKGGKFHNNLKWPGRTLGTLLFNQGVERLEHSSIWGLVKKWRHSKELAYDESNVGGMINPEKIHFIQFH